MDLDGNGRSDILSGSWPGEVYWFRRQADGRFAAAETLKQTDGEPVNVGSAASAFAVDWNGNGRLDLLVGTLLGDVYFLPNVGEGDRIVFGPAEKLTVDGEPIQHTDAAPVAADWDGDGRLDLLVGTEAGSVVWYRNSGTAQEPRLSPPQTLVEDSPVGWQSDRERQVDLWGRRAKICVVDWNHNGRLDLLMGDVCGSFEAKPEQTTQEQAEEAAALNGLPELRKQWAETFQEYRALLASTDDEALDPATRDQQLESLRQTLKRYKDEIAAAQAITQHYQSQRQSHGFVWLFLRKADGE